MADSTIQSTLSTTLSSIVSTTSQAASTMSSQIKREFSWYDYTIFALMLLVSALIGIYFGFFAKKQSTSKEYLMGGKEMKVIPIVISLVASHTSGITLMAVPANVYQFGSAYWLAVISKMIVSVITVYVYLPVFYNLGITSTYEYLGMRFDDRCRKCASGLFALAVFIYLPIVIYIPALAFAAVSGVNVMRMSVLICSICVFYTTIGGLKAVVWTDAIQFTVTMGASVVVFFLGLHTAGGLSTVWNVSKEGGRLEIFNFDPNPTTRETFWALVIGFTVHWISYTSVNQGCIQKFLSVPTYRDSVKAVFLYGIGMSLTKTISVLTGLIMFTKYSQCDPLLTNQIQKKDQLLPYYVLDVAGHIPGLCGLFIAGLFSAALSTLSANLNSLAGTIYEDFLKDWLERHHNTKTAGYILKFIVVITGVLCTTMIFVVQHLGGLLALSISLSSVAHGPLLGMFTLGVLFPRANKQGAFYGALSGMSCMVVIIMGSNYYASKGLIKDAQRPVSLEGCASDMAFNMTSLIINATISQSTNTTHDEPLFLFRLSFYWYTLIGTLVTIIVGLIVSYLTKKDENPIDKKLLSPVIHFLLPNEKEVMPMGSVNGDYCTVDGALEKLTVLNESRTMEKQ